MVNFNGPLVGVKEQIALLLHEASVALCKKPPQIETAKKAIYGVTVLLERNEVIDPDFEYLQHLDSKKKTDVIVRSVEPEIRKEVEDPSSRIKNPEDILKEFGW